MNSFNWKQTSSQLFYSRNDNQDLRWGDFAKSKLIGKELLNLQNIENQSYSQFQKPPIGVWGYADDEGIALNGGRVGAQFAPDMIRRFFYRLTPPLACKDDFEILDYGNWTRGTSLENQIKEISPILGRQLIDHPMISLGGGHDYGAVDGAGFLQWNSNQKSSATMKPLIINFDAHLDVRPWQKGLNSGTPFSWLLDHYPDQFDFLEIGIQNHCTSPHHLEWLHSKKIPILDINFIRKVGILNALRQILAGSSPNQNCFISLDIDVFSQNSAPGCSQSWDAGLNWEEMVSALTWILKSKKVRLLGIYEVSPPLDRDHQTSKLAACLMDIFVKNYWTNL